MTSGHCAHLAGARRQSGPRPDPAISRCGGGPQSRWGGTLLSRLSLDRPKSFARGGSFDRLRTGAARGGCAHGRALHGDRRCKALTVDRWTAAGAYVPPPERRGLVLVDPPFEEVSDFTHLSEILAVAHRKWATGSYLLGIRSRIGRRSTRWPGA